MVEENILLEGHNVLYDEFSIFKLHLKESLLIKRDNLEHNRNIYTHPLMMSVIVTFIFVLLQ